MEKIYWNKLSIFKKAIFCLGWINIFNIGFWFVMLIYSSITQDEKFFGPGSYRVVYVFG